MRLLPPWGMKVRQKLVERRMTAEDLARAVGARSGNYVRDMIYGFRAGKKYIGKINQYLGLDA